MDRQRTEARQSHAAVRRAWRSAIAGLAVLLAWQVVPASAAPQHNPKGRFLGVVKSARAAERPTPQAQRQAQLAAGNLTYHQGLLEIEMPGRIHELIKRFVGELVAAALKFRAEAVAA